MATKTPKAAGPAGRGLKVICAREGFRRAGRVFGREPVITGEGGSIPVVNDFARILGAPVLLVGFGLPGENAHAPDEWISQENFRLGMKAMAALWEQMDGRQL